MLDLSSFFVFCITHDLLYTLSERPHRKLLPSSYNPFPYPVHHRLYFIPAAAFSSMPRILFPEVFDNRSQYLIIIILLLPVIQLHRISVFFTSQRNTPCPTVFPPNHHPIWNTVPERVFMQRLSYQILLPSPFYLTIHRNSALHTLIPGTLHRSFQLPPFLFFSLFRKVFPMRYWHSILSNGF